MPGEFDTFVLAKLSHMQTVKPKDIDDYIAGFPKDIQKMLQQVRVTVQKAAPKAEEAIKYNMPTFVLNGNLVHFAAYKAHIGFYPAPTGNPAFKKDFEGYTTGKGTIQFPFDKPLPLSLITKIVKHRIKDMAELADIKKITKR